MSPWAFQRKKRLGDLLSEPGYGVWMVRRGEYLERAVVIHGAQILLDGLYHRGPGRPGVLIAPPDPDDGHMESPSVAEIAWSLTQQGRPTLRFNYRGVGGSPGIFEGRASMGLDLDVARLHLLETLGEPRGRLAGVGVGAGAGPLVELARRHRISPLVLIAPPDLPDMRDHPSAWHLVRPSGLRRPEVENQLEEQGVGAAWTVIPDADPCFRNGLVALGRAVTEKVTADAFDRHESKGLHVHP